MKKVLYISNIEVPYRTTFFNQLSKKCELTVLYERKKSSNRNEIWSKSVKKRYNVKYLKGLNFKNEYALDITILKHVFSKKYDKIIIGCYNSPSQILAILFMRIFRKKFILNIDGEYFLEGKNIKNKIKRFFIKGADAYLVAGEKNARNFSKIVSKEKVYAYHFSSLTDIEIKLNAKKRNNNTTNDILVIGQYFDYKGLDVALRVARKDNELKFKFIGSGNRSQLLEKEIQKMNLKNVKVEPFLSKEQLEKEYQNCEMILLPSKKECWGLVINEAASFGCPIISTYGSGAGIEFLEEKYLAKVSNENDIYMKIIELKKSNNKNAIKENLMQKSQRYSIEKMVEDTMKIIEK